MKVASLVAANMPSAISDSMLGWHFEGPFFISRTPSTAPPRRAAARQRPLAPNSTSPASFLLPFRQQARTAATRHCRGPAVPPVEGPAANRTRHTSPPQSNRPGASPAARPPRTPWRAACARHYEKGVDLLGEVGLDVQSSESWNLCAQEFGDSGYSVAAPTLTIGSSVSGLRWAEAIAIGVRDRPVNALVTQVWQKSDLNP